MIIKIIVFNLFILLFISTSLYTLKKYSRLNKKSPSMNNKLVMILSLLTIVGVLIAGGTINYIWYTILFL